MGPPPAAALTLTTGLPGDSPAFPVRSTLSGCPVPRTTTEPQRTPATGTLPRNGPPARIEVAARPQAAVTVGTIQGFRECPAGPLAGACAIIFHNVAGLLPRLSKGQGKRRACHGQRRGHAAGSSHVLQFSHTPKRPSNTTRAFCECRSGKTE